MQKIFYSLILLTLALSCSDKYKSIYQSAPGPTLYFNADTIKVRERDFLNIMGTGVLYLFSSPALHQMNVTYNDTSGGKVHFKYRNSLLVDSRPVIVAGDSTAVYVSCDLPGIYSIDLFLTDQLGKTTSRQLIVQCFADQQIKTSLTARLIDSSQVDNWAYEFDGSGCLKPDGKIVAYHFTVNGNEMHTNVPYFFWTFHSRGEQTVSLYATDDLLKLSDTTTIKIIIP